MENIKEELNHNQIASRAKIFLSSILDFTIHMLLLMLIYAFVASPIISYGGFYEPYETSKSEFFDHVEKTHLYEFDEKGEPVNSKISAANYIASIIKTNYYLDGKQFHRLVNGMMEVVTLTDKDTLYYQKDGLYVNDNLANYFFNYRDTSDLPDNIKSDLKGNHNKSDLFYREYLNLKDASNRLYFNEELFNDGHIDSYNTSKRILTNQYAELLHDYIFLNKESSEASELYLKLDRMYHNAVNMAFEELDSYSPSYKLVMSNIEKAESNIYATKIVGVVLSYVLSFTIYWILIPLLIKQNRSFGLKYNHLVYTTIKDKKPQVKHIIVKDIILFLTQGISMAFPILFMGTSAILFTPFGWFRFIHLIVFLALVSLSSIIMAAWGKKHQFLGEYTANLVTKDTDSYKVSEEHAVIE